MQITVNREAPWLRLSARRRAVDLAMKEFAKVLDEEQGLFSDYRIISFADPFSHRQQKPEDE